MNFPLSYLCLYLNYSPESTYVVAIFVAFGCLLLRLAFLKKMVQLSVRSFFKNVCVKVFFVTIVASVIPTILHYRISYGWERLLVVGSVSILTSVLAIYYIGCSKGERQFVASKMMAFKQKVLG